MGIRLLSAGVAAAVLAGAGVAHAQTREFLDCAAGTVAGDFSARFLDTATDPDQSDAHSQMVEPLSDKVSQCAQQYDLPTDQWPIYFDYTQNRIEHEEIARRLSAAGIRPQVLDDALDFGPGRSNPVLSGALSDAQVDAIYSAVVNSGIKADDVSDDTWAYMGVYVQSASGMWNALSALGPQ